VDNWNKPSSDPKSIDKMEKANTEPSRDTWPSKVYSRGVRRNSPFWQQSKPLRAPLEQDRFLDILEFLPQGSAGSRLDMTLEETLGTRAWRMNLFISEQRREMVALSLLRVPGGMMEGRQIRRKVISSSQIRMQVQVQKTEHFPRVPTLGFQGQPCRENR
jgi:hypothetical protein